MGVGNCELSLPSYNNSETLIQIYDILVSTYDKLLKKCYWVTSNGLAPNILKIQVTTVENDTDRQFAMASPIMGYHPKPPYNVDVKNLSISQMHKEFVKILAKRYNILNANSFKIFQKECPNFGQWTMEEVNNEFKKFDFICVYDNVDEKGNIDETVVNGTKFTWSGLTSNQLEEEANRQTPHNYTNEGSVSHLITNIKNNMGTYRKKGVCAKAVRLAMVGANMIPADAVKPASACAYSLHLPHWGFKCVHQYISGTKFDFELQEGDIDVVAACPKNVHGHIAVYVDGKWYADKTTNNINPYHDKGRPVKIYRYMRNADN